MIEKDFFRESYYRGRLLWVKGPEGLEKAALVRKMLQAEQIETSEVLEVDGETFLRLMAQGVSRKEMSGYRTLLIRNFESLSESLWADFLSRLDLCRLLRFELDVRTILISSDEIQLSRKFEILDLSPVVIRIQGEGNFAFDANDRVHRLIDEASRIAKKSVFRMSERAAVFLESLDEDWSDDELLALLTWGIFRMKDRVLRFSDLLPQKRLEIDAPDAFESA